MAQGTNLAVALELARVGIPVFPAHVLRRRSNSWMKKPAVEGWRAHATTEEAQIAAWWRQFPRALPGIELEQAGLVVIDPDRHGNGADGMEAFAQLCADLGGLPKHPITDTPAGNHHIFRQPDGTPLSNSAGGLPAGVDIRGAGGWIVAPGAVRADGVVYAPRKGTPTLPEAFRTQTIPPLPEKLIGIIRAEGSPGDPRGDDSAKASPFMATGERLDIEACLENMQPNGASVNATQPRVILSLLQKAMHPDDVVDLVVNRTMDVADRASLGWSREVEIKCVTARVKSSLNRLHHEYDPDTGVIPPWLAGEFHNDWAEALKNGLRPLVRRNQAGWYVCAYGRKDVDSEARTEPGGGPARDDGPKSPKPAKPGVFVLRPFVPFDLATLPPRQWLYGRHYQRCTVSATVAPGGYGKTSLCMVEAVAMGTCRNLLGEQPEERLRVWYHNGEDSLEELHRRLGAICLHYGIPQEELRDWLFVTSGNEIPLRVAKGYSNLEIDVRLRGQIADAVADNQIDVAILDPLVTLHGVPEGDNMKMYAVISIFAGMANSCSCSFELAHHTRKMLAGNGAVDYTVDDARGASSIRDAVRAVRLLNHMSQADADLTGVLQADRMSYFRIDRGKANNAPPARVATWRRFVNVDLPNGDEVGVVTPWEFPGQGAPTPEKAEAEQRAEQVFLQLLDRCTAEGSNISARSGPNYAPARFAPTPMAKAAGVSKAALIIAMQRLLDAGRIKMEAYGRGDREARRLARGVRMPEEGLL
jgi:RecA-family ATPase